MNNAKLATLDLQALRAFICGVELGSFALAATRLHRSTSAVSAQLRKLEQQAGCPLLEKSGRGLVPTASGELLLSYGRRLLALNDEALEALQGQALSGELRFGAQEDFAETLLPQLLGRFARAHPRVQLSTRVGRNQALIQALAQGELDLALAWENPQAPWPKAQTLAQVPLAWYGQDLETLLARGEPLPLVLFEAPCLMRQAATQALDQAGIAWRPAYTSASLGGIWAAVKAGLGITVRGPYGVPQGVAAVQGLPRLGSLAVQLLRPAEPRDDALRLGQIIEAELLP